MRGTNIVLDRTACALALLIAGCSAPTAGLGGTDGGSAGATGSGSFGSSAGATSASGSGGSSAGSASASGTSSSSSGGSGGSGGTGTTGAASATAGTGGSTTGGSSTGGSSTGGSSTGGSSTGGSSTGGSSTGGSTGGMTGSPLYGPCENALDCQEGLACADQGGWVGLGDYATGTWCTQPCMKNEDCPDAPSGDAPAVCEMGICKLNCDEFAGGGMCPPDMKCLTSVLNLDVCGHVP